MMPRDSTFDSVTAKSRTTAEAGQQIPDGLVRDLVGSADDTAPASGLVSEINTAISDGYRYLNIRGAWTMGGELSYSSGDYTPFGIVFDARGAYIEYAGSGWAITNDNTGDISSQIAGGYQRLYGGNWVATASPNGLYRGIDIAHDEFMPRRTGDWNGATGDAGTEVCRWEVGTRWCETSVFGGFHSNADTGLRGYDSDRTDFNSSFQDNLIWDSQHGNTNKYGFYLEGNWIDCAFVNPTVIASQNGVAAFYSDANMNGTMIYNLEIEDAASSVTHYIAEFGVNSRAGPVMVGGDEPSGDRFNGIANGDWSWAHWWNKNHSFYFDAHSARDQSMRLDMKIGTADFVWSTATDANSAFSAIMELDSAGNLTHSGSHNPNTAP